MKHLIIFMSATLLLQAGAVANDLAINEFRKSGAGLRCTTNTFNPKDRPDYLQCLRIGPIHIGQKMAAVERLLGKPWKVMPQGKTAEVRVYPIDIEASPKPYWVITYEAGKTYAIQLTGEHTPKALSFSSLRIGDKKRQLVKILGRPTRIVKVKEIGADNWIYRPFPISVEIKHGKVYSIRIWRK